MSANRATNQQLGFHRWLASLKREAPSAPGVTKAPLSAPPAASTAPPAEHGVSTAPPPRAKRDDDATRVHHIPKEIIYSLRARAASEAPKPLQEERTHVFRAPPELLARAKRAQSKSDAPSEASAAPSNGSLEHDFSETPEARSGVSLRLPEPPPSTLPPELGHEIEQPHEVEEALDDATVLLPADAPARPQGVEPALTNEALLELPSEASSEASELPSEASSEALELPSQASSEALLELPSEASSEALELPSEASSEQLNDAPSFRPPLARKLWVVALMAAAVVSLLALVDTLR